MAQTAQVAPDWSGLVEAIQRKLHESAVTNALGQTGQFGAEETQLNYQIATQAYQDLPLAPDGRIGFEMMVLRMLAFRPARAEQYPQRSSEGDPEASVAKSPAPAEISQPAESEAETGTGEVESPVPSPDPQSSITDVKNDVKSNVAELAEQAVATEPVDLPWAEQEPPPSQPVTPAPSQSSEPARAPAEGDLTLSAEQWTDLLSELGMAGFGESMLRASEWLGMDGSRARLRIPEDARDLFSEPFQQRAATLLSQRLQRPVTGLAIEWTQPQSATPAEVLKERAAQRLQRAQAAFANEPSVQWLVDNFDGQVDPQSIVPKGDV